MTKPLPTLEDEAITSIPVLTGNVVPLGNNSKNTATKETRDYLWKKGQSGNPNGRPKASYLISDLAKQHTAEALATLVEICNDKGASPNARVSAAGALLDRAWGKPIQSLQPVNADVDVRDWKQMLIERAPQIEADLSEARKLEAARWKAATD